jgi:hypothetical protein
MQPTYSYPEIKKLLYSLDLGGINILRELIEEEENCYQPYELKALLKLLHLRKLYVTRNEIKFEYLLSFN